MSAHCQTCGGHFGCCGDHTYCQQCTCGWTDVEALKAAARALLDALPDGGVTYWQTLDARKALEALL